MTAKLDPWQGDWRTRVYERVRASGHRDVSAFARAAPAVPYRQLATTLGASIAPIQLEKLLREEALAANRFGAFARDCLARYLRQDLPEGWARGAQAEFNTARAFASWSAALSDAQENTTNTTPGDRVRTQTERIWRHLQRGASPGWLPRDAADPVLLEAFHDFDFAR